MGDADAFLFLPSLSLDDKKLIHPSLGMMLPLHVRLTTDLTTTLSLWVLPQSCLCVPLKFLLLDLHHLDSETQHRSFKRIY